MPSDLPVAAKSIFERPMFASGSCHPRPQIVFAVRRLGYRCIAGRSPGPTNDEGMTTTLQNPAGPLCFRAALERYILHLRASGRSGATLESYRGSLGWLGNRLGNEIVLPAITSDGLNEAMVALLAGGAGPALSEVTGNRHRSAWRAFFRWAQAEGYIAINPARQLHLAWVDALPTMPISLTV